tara:strand:- start:124 stop:345 length:222 start_codon:yes stop_codon:yes gene_type:complete
LGKLNKNIEQMKEPSSRYTMRDRLRAVECPMDMIDQIGGWRSVGGVGLDRVWGVRLDQLAEHLRHISIDSQQI